MMAKKSSHDRRLRWLVAVVIIGGILLAGYWYLTGGASPDDRPEGTLADIESLSERTDVNVFFVLIDTLRSDRLGSYGYDRDTSPAMDYLALTGVRFDKHRAQSSWTKSSMASLWSGLYPTRTDVLRHTDTVPESAELPAEILRDAGYSTAGLWRNGWVAPNFGFSQGFDVYQSPIGQQAPATMRSEARAGRIDGTDIDLVFTTKEFLRANQDTRWFLYVHFMDVHQYISAEETALFGSSYSDSYDNAILWTDSQLGEILMEIYRLGLGKKTLIVVVSDHGEAFGEHGAEGHARDLFQEVVGTPFILSLPFRLPEPAVVRAHSENVDVWPTLLDMLGIPGLEGADGISHRPLLLGEKNQTEREVGFARLDRNWGRLEVEESPLIAVREGNLRLIHVVDSPEKDLLYDIGLDPREQRNIADSREEAKDRLLEKAREQMSLEPHWEGGSGSVEIDEMQLKQLRALGYSIE